MTSPTAHTPPTIRDVAASAAVSVATVSRVLNESAGVTEPTRAAVRSAIERTGYIPRRRRVDRGRRPPLLRDVIAVRCPYALSDYFGTMLSAIARSCEPYGKRILLSSGAELGGETLADALLSQATEGAVLILPPESPAALERLHRDGYPFVVIDPRMPLSAEIAAVSADHAAGAAALTAHLIGLGHRRIGVIAGPAGWVATDARLAGHRASIAAAGLPPARDLLVGGDEPNESSGFAAGRHLLSLPHRPTAIAAFNDKVALGCLEAAAALGLRVPQDVSIAGFDDLPLTRVTSPRLTTVRQPLEAMAGRATSLLLQSIAGHPAGTRQLELATELVVRESTAPPGGSSG